jgi:hypothetical protein
MFKLNYKKKTTTTQILLTLSKGNYNYETNGSVKTGPGNRISSNFDA